MIVAEIYTHSDNKIAAFVVSGHSTVGSHGYNICCAEVSMLTQSAYLGITRYLNRDVALNNHEHGGLGIELKNAPDELTEAIFQTMLIGLRKIEEITPELLKIEMIHLNTSAEANLQNKIKKMTPSRNRPLPEVNINDVKICTEIYRNDDGKITGFAVKESDNESLNELKIYCASIWALIKASFIYIKDYLKRDSEFEIAPSKLAMNLIAQPDEITEAVFQTMLIGLCEVEKLAPQIVRVEEKNSLGGEKP